MCLLRKYVEIQSRRPQPVPGNPQLHMIFPTYGPVVAARDNALFCAACFSQTMSRYLTGSTPQIACFIDDGSPDVRYYGRRMINDLMYHEDFESSLNRFLPPKLAQKIKDRAAEIKQRVKLLQLCKPLNGGQTRKQDVNGFFQQISDNYDVYLKSIFLM